MKQPSAMGAAAKLLRNVDALQHRTNACERAIRKAAVARLADAMDEREALGPRTLLDERAADQYLHLTEEIGHLQRVLAEADRNLAPKPAAA